MKLKVNGREEHAAEGLTIKSYLESKGINPAAIVVEHNFDVPDKEKWADILLKENDNLEIVRFIGGG